MSCADSASPLALVSQGTPGLLGDSPKYAVLFSCRSPSTTYPLV